MAAGGTDAFEFIYGRWDVHNRKIRDVTDRQCQEWVEFPATSDVFPVLHGIGHIDRMFVPDPPDGPAFEGFTLRLFEPETQLWRIWWSSTRRPGHLDPPVVGRFDGGHGTFECEDVIGGEKVHVRFEWDSTDPDRPAWQQSFSYDAGASWTLNWQMFFSRS